jgi:hypothetical protein
VQKWPNGQSSHPIFLKKKNIYKKIKKLRVIWEVWNKISQIVKFWKYWGCIAKIKILEVELKIALNFGGVKCIFPHFAYRYCFEIGGPRNPFGSFRTSLRG